MLMATAIKSEFATPRGMPAAAMRANTIARLSATGAKAANPSRNDRSSKDTSSKSDANARKVEVFWLVTNSFTVM